MLTGHAILCFANDWDSDPTSKKHVMRRLARHNQVLWIDSIGCRRPRASARDARRVVTKLRSFLRGCRHVAPNVWAFSPLAIPFHESALARRINRVALAAGVRLAARRFGGAPRITWSFVPSSADVVGRLGERLVVYHCVDEFSEFSGVDGANLLAMEARLAGKADLVVVSSQPLLEVKRRLNPETILVRHGVEVEHFAGALDPALEVPADLGPRDRPVVGFFGLLADWVDLDLVRFCAERRPEWSFVLVGRAEAPVEAVAGLGNVRLLGWRPYGELPAYCKGFDVGILPFRINELTLASNPLKLREYVAAGLPVVSTDIPEAAVLGCGVRIGRDAAGFLTELDALVASRDLGPSPSRAAMVAGESWDAKTAELARIAAGRLAAKSASARAAPAPLSAHEVAEP